MKRVGLFVGVDKYQDIGISPLRCAVKDATALMAAFSRAQFDTVDSLLNDDARDDKIIDKVENIMSELNSGDLFVFYFSGHGREFANTNYLVGPTARANTELYQRGSVSLPELIAITNKEGVNRLFILDCCRSSILANRSGVYSVDNSRDIALNAALKSDNNSIVPPLILCSCSTGEQAFEGPVHGYFTDALLNSIERKDIQTFQDFQRSLLITGTPKPQNISWNGNSILWEKISLFKHWDDLAGERKNNPNQDFYVWGVLNDEIQNLLPKLKDNPDNRLNELLACAERAKKEANYTSAADFLRQAKTMILAALHKAASANESKNNVVSRQIQILKKTDRATLFFSGNVLYTVSGNYYIVFNSIKKALQQIKFKVVDEDFNGGRIVAKYGIAFLYISFYSNGNWIDIEIPPNSEFAWNFEKLAKDPVKDFIETVPLEDQNIIPPTISEHEGTSYEKEAELYSKLAWFYLIPFTFIGGIIENIMLRHKMKKANNYSGVEYCTKVGILTAVGIAISYITPFLLSLILDR